MNKQDMLEYIDIMMSGGIVSCSTCDDFYDSMKELVEAMPEQRLLPDSVGWWAGSTYGNKYVCWEILEQNGRFMCASEEDQNGKIDYWLPSTFGGTWLGKVDFEQIKAGKKEISHADVVEVVCLEKEIKRLKEKYNKLLHIYLENMKGCNICVNHLKTCVCSTCPNKNESSIKPEFAREEL